MKGARRGIIAGSFLGAWAMLATGCGELTIRTWVNVVEDESGGFVSLDFGGTEPFVLDVLRMQGGLLTEITLNTTEILGPMEGSLAFRDVRLAGEVYGGIGKLCAWNDPTGSSGGTLMLDLLNGTTDSDIFLDAKARTQLNDSMGLPSLDLEQAVDLDLGAGLNADALLAAIEAGTADGLFATTTSLSSSVELSGVGVTFNLDLALTNGAEPPLFDADLLEYCSDEFASQGLGEALFYGINSKSGYLRGLAKDSIRDPLVISLAELGASPGDILRLDTVGTYAPLEALMDGTETRLGGVFSSTDEVLDPSVLDRIPGAIDVAPNVYTWVSIVCIFGKCIDLGGDDIPEDFRIDPAIDIAVPEGAEYLVVAPIDALRNWQDNSGFGFGLTVEVDPEEI
jgi:hypothetical protein